MKRDCYGHAVIDPFFRPPKLTPCEIVEAGGYTYLRFTTAPVGPIHRIDATQEGVTKIMWAYGAWADRAALTYDHTLNEPIEIQEA